MKGSIYIGQFAKVKVFVHWTFFILLVYIFFSGISVGHSLEAIGWHILFVISIFACILLHEFGHALTGLRFGFKTKDIILLPIGGVARFEKLPESPKQEFLIAIAGPFVNFFLALILFLITQAIPSNLITLDFSSINPGNFLILLIAVNLLLGLFNLIPAFPMDGGRIFRALLAVYLSRERATQIATTIGSILAIGMIFLGLFYNFFLILIGIFIILSSSVESSTVSVQALLNGHTARELVMHKFDVLDENLSIAEASKSLLDGSATNFVVISLQKDIIGTLTSEQLIASLRANDLQTPISKIMSPVSHVIPSETPLMDIYRDELLKSNALHPITENGKIIGMINLDNILEFIAFKKATSDWESLIKRN